MRASTPYANKQLGATLIEVLVSMVILAIALLGMAGLTSASMKYDYMTRVRGTGLSLVNDYAERARANLIGFVNTTSPYSYTVPYAPEVATTEPTVNACAVTAGTGGANTCALAIAAYDKAQWLNTVANRLPGGSAYIDTTNQAFGGADIPTVRTINIWLIWKDQQLASGTDLSQNCPNEAGIDRTTNPEIVCMFFRVTL